MGRKLRKHGRVDANRSPPLSFSTTIMGINVGCAAALFTLIQFFVDANAANVDLRRFDFHVNNLQRNGVQRTVINGRSQFLASLFLECSLIYAPSRSIPRYGSCCESNHTRNAD